MKIIVVPEIRITGLDSFGSPIIESRNIVFRDSFVSDLFEVKTDPALAFQKLWDNGIEIDTRDLELVRLVDLGTGTVNPIVLFVAKAKPESWLSPRTEANVAFIKSQFILTHGLPLTVMAIGKYERRHYKVLPLVKHHDAASCHVVMLSVGR
jgi:hypothetical protein